MKTQTLKSAMVKLAQAQQKMAQSDIATFERGGYPKHNLFPYRAEREARERLERIRNKTVDLFERV